MSEIMNLRNATLVNTYIGPESSRMAGALCQQLNLRKAFVLCDAGVKEAGLLDGVLESLEEKEISFCLYDRVEPDAPDTMIDEAAGLCKEQGCRVVIAVGGGSTLDTAKGVALLQNNPGRISEYALDRARTRVKGARLILIPTTSGTGSEITTGAMVAIESMGIKSGFSGRELLADFALLDPLLTLGLPRVQTAATAMDALSHCVEAMLSGIVNPVCDILDLEGIRLLIGNIERVVENGGDVEARQSIMFAAYLGGMAMNGSSCGYGHAIAHAIGAKYHVPHGVICAAALPMELEYFGEIYPEQIRRIAGAMGVALPVEAGGAEAAAATADAIRALNVRLGLPGFSELGFDYDALPELAELAMDDACVSVLHRYVPGRKVCARDFLASMRKEYRLGRQKSGAL